jgi:putative addiction module component (TIGR02574 family)
MQLSKDQIRSASLQLGPAEREALAEELLLSIEPAEAEAIDAAWLDEARRRDEAFYAGTTHAKPVEDVIQRLLNKSRP